MNLVVILKPTIWKHPAWCLHIVGDQWIESLFLCPSLTRNREPPQYNPSSKLWLRFSTYILLPLSPNPTTKKLCCQSYAPSFSDKDGKEWKGWNGGISSLSSELTRTSTGVSAIEEVNWSMSARCSWSSSSDKDRHGREPGFQKDLVSRHMNNNLNRLIHVITEWELCRGEHLTSSQHSQRLLPNYPKYLLQFCGTAEPQHREPGFSILGTPFL